MLSNKDQIFGIIQDYLDDLIPLEDALKELTIIDTKKEVINELRLERVELLDIRKQFFDKLTLYNMRQKKLQKLNCLVKSQRKGKKSK